MKTQLTIFDQFITTVDDGLRTLFSNSLPKRQNPASDQSELALTQKEKQKSGALMRINHVGEICAQALYRGQALTAQNKTTLQAMKTAAEEETDHLAWCEQRINELHTHKSFLNPLWYTGAFSLGMLAGLFGDRLSLGFVVETENQVEKHLQQHLTELPENDLKSRAILKQMREDEIHHASTALKNGAQELPQIVKKTMTIFSKIMTTTAYWL